MAGRKPASSNQPERAALAAAAKPKQDAVGWRMVDDLVTGARLGIPTKPPASRTTSAAASAMEFGARRIFGRDVPQHAAGTTLAAVFERMKKEPAGRKADYSLLRPDFFVISGLQT